MDLRAAGGVPQRLCRPRFPRRVGTGARRRRQLPRAQRQSISNLGAYTASFVPLTKGTQLMTSLYRMPAAARARGVLSNTPWTAPYRSAGRPEAMFVIERLIDHRRPRAWLRPRRAAPAQPHHDDAAHQRLRRHLRQRRLRRHARPGAEARRLERLRRRAGQRSRRAGCGAASGSAAMSNRRAARRTNAPRSRCWPEGMVEIVIGTLSSGQGHATSFAQLVANGWACRPTRCGSSPSDSDRVSVGGGSHSGRSMRLAATTIHQASHGIVAKGLKLAAAAARGEPKPTSPSPTAASPSKGTDRGVGLFELAAERGPIADAGRCRQPGRLLSLRLACLRGRGRCRDGRRADRALHDHRRCRPRREPADPARPDPWRHRPGRGPGADGALLLRRPTASFCRARSWTTPCRTPTTSRSSSRR